MSPVRLVFLLTACAALAAPLAEPCRAVDADHRRRRLRSADDADASAASTSTPRAGAPALIGYVHLTQPIYQITVEQAFAMVDAQRAAPGAVRRRVVTREARGAPSRDGASLELGATAG